MLNLYDFVVNDSEYIGGIGCVLFVSPRGEKLLDVAMPLICEETGLSPLEYINDSDGWMDFEFIIPKEEQENCKLLVEYDSAFHTVEIELSEEESRQLRREFRTLFLLVGPSGSGKSTLAGALEKEGFVSVKSFTTRPPRGENEGGHIFVSEYNAPSDTIAHAVYDGYDYWTTESQLGESDVYVVDPEEALRLQSQLNTSRNVAIVFLNPGEETCRERMAERGDSSESVEKRLEYDKKLYEKIQKVLEDYSEIVFTNETVEEMVKTIKEY